MIKPPFLNPGDTIAIAGPAGKINQNIVNEAAMVLETWGLKVKIANNLFKNHFGFSATDSVRLKDFQQAMDDQKVKAILCARGGYGTNRIIDHLDFSKFLKYPKWIVGFSDITVLHNHIQSILGIETIHGSMCFGLANAASSVETAESLRKVLFGEKIEYKIQTDKLAKRGVAEGILTGGNLAILMSLINTPSDVDTSGKILFIEETGEYLYRIDRMMTQLKRAGKLAKLAGLLVGDFDELPDSEQTFGKSVHDIILDAVKAYDYPVLFNFPGGHGNDNRSLVLGRKMTLEVGEIGTISF